MIFHFPALTVASFEQLLALIGGAPCGAHIQQVNEEVGAQHARAIGKEAAIAAVEVGAQHAQTAQQHRQLRRAQRELLRFIQQQRFGRRPALHAAIVAETVSQRLQKIKGFDIGLVLTRIDAPRRKGHLHRYARRRRGHFDADIARQHDDVRQRRFARSLLNLLQYRQHVADHAGVNRPLILRRQRQTCAVRAAALVAAAEGRSGCPGSGNQLAHAQPGGRNLRFQLADIAGVRLMDRRRQRILPQQIFFRHFRTQVARFRPHIAVGQFVPGAGEGFVERLRIVEEATRDLFELRIEAQRQVGDQHGRLALFLRIERIGNNRVGVAGFKLDSARRALRLHPLILEQVLEEVVAPLGRGLRPDHFQPGSNGVCARAAAVAAAPAEALGFNRRGFRVNVEVAGGARAVRFTQRMAAGDQRHHLFVVHAHIAESGTDRRRGRGRVAARFRAFRVNVDQTHFGGAERRVGEAFRMAMRQPLGFVAPVHIHIRFPHVFTPGAEAEGTEAGVLQRNVARENIEVGPGNFLAIFLFHRPQQATRFIQADVVRPGVERRETLLSAPGAAATVDGAVGARAVPRHTDKQADIAAPVGRPPGLRIGQQRADVRFQRRIVELAELFAVVEVGAKGVGAAGVLI